MSRLADLGHILTRRGCGATVYLGLLPIWPAPPEGDQFPHPDPELESRLRPGIFARGSVVISEREDALAPRTRVSRAGAGPPATARPARRNRTGCKRGIQRPILVIASQLEKSH